MDNYKFAIIFGNDNEKNNTSDGEVIHYGDNLNGELHIKSFLRFIEEYYNEDTMLSKINIYHQYSIPAYLLTKMGNIVIANSTDLAEEELKKYGRSSIIFLPDTITPKQYESLIEIFDELKEYDIMIDSNIRIENGFLNSDSDLTTGKIGKEKFEEKIKSIVSIKYTGKIK